MTSLKELVSKRLRSRVTYSPLDVYVDEVFRHKGIINLATGSPSTSLMPLKELSDAVREVVDSCSNEAFTYPPPLGIKELRHELKTFAKELGVNVEGYDLIIGAGALHIIDLIGKVLLDENDCVIVEEPTYIEAIMPLKFYTNYIDTLPLDEGSNYSKLNLKNIDRVCSNAKVFYTIPTSQNPTGVTYDEHTRNDIIRHMKDRNIVMVEDDTYRSIFRTNYEPIINKCVKYGIRCIYLSSLSKILTPSLRLAYALIPKELTEFFAEASFLNLPLSTLAMYVVLIMIKKGVLFKRISHLSKIFESRLKALKDSLTEYLSDRALWNDDAYGMYLLIRIPGVDTEKLFWRSLKEGVGFVPGHVFFLKREVRDTLRLSIAFEDEERIVEGVKRISKALKDLT